MVLLLVISIVTFTAIMLLVRKLKMIFRLSLAAACFVIINSPSIFAMVVGDEALPDAVTVSIEELQDSVAD